MRGLCSSENSGPDVSGKVAPLADCIGTGCTRMLHVMRQGRVFACRLFYPMLLPALLAVIAATATTAAARSTDGAIGHRGHFTRTIRMPGAVSEKEDDLVCHTMKLDPREHQYILKYEPHATKKIAHHMMLYGCETPGSTEPVWHCGGEGRGELSVCGVDETSGSGRPAEAKIVYAWALDAPPTEFPEGVGLRVGGDTQIKYIIVQLHYSRKFAEGESDHSSGVTLHMTYNKLPYQAGFYVLGNYGFVPPKTKDFHLESACIYSHDHDLHPIRYRTHSHNLGTVTSGYRIRNGTWTEIGRMSPKAPQTFYPVTHGGMTVRKNDILASRCTMTSDRDTPTEMGAKNKDEMCNFYIMYYTDKQENLRDTYCFNDAQQFHWKNYLKNVPADASSLRGVNVTAGHGMR